MNVVNVPGEKSRHIMLYALSTCVWCQKTKKLLNDLGVAYEYVDVDRCQGESRQEAVEKLKACNPRVSFPTVVIDNDTCINGYKVDDIREALGK